MQTGSLKQKYNRQGVKVWRAQWRENGQGRTRILGRVLDMTRAEARAELDKILAPLITRNRKMRGAPVGATLQRYVEGEYLLAKSRVWKASTRHTTEHLIERYILPELGARVLSSITRRELQDLLDEKAAAGLSFSIVAHVRWQLVAIFRMALSDGLLTVDPAAALVTPKCEGTVDKSTITVQDMQRGQMLLGQRERLIFRLAVYEGLRPGEIVGLQLGDIDGDVLKIQRRVYRGQVDSPKSRASVRRKPMTAGTRALMGEYLELLRNRDAGAWLFPSEAETTPIWYGSARERIQKTLEAVGLGGVTFQALRRTWVTESRQAEKDAKLTASMGGHSVDVHENEYRQPSDDALRRSVRKFERRVQ